MLLLQRLADFVWGLPLIVTILATGVYCTIRFRLIQLRKFPHALAIISGKYDSPDHQGQISHFQALCTALSGTIGTGNIAGVATAIAAGGPGAAFWMWVTAILGMAIKYTSCSLAVMYRKVDKNGVVHGGPMYYIELGMGKRYRFLALIFAFCTTIAVIGGGNMVQANSVATALVTFVPANWSGPFRLGTGLFLSLMTGLVIIGGIRRIALVTSRLVPFMSILYVGTGIIIILLNLEKIPVAFASIFTGAFSPQSIIGGVAGAAVRQTIRMGVARGIFSNESGLGTSPMAHAAAKTDWPAREGLVAMIGPFIDSILINSMTTLVIVISGLWFGGGLDGAPLTSKAFSMGIPGGHVIVSFSLVFFAYSTMISWYYYAERTVEYLWGNKGIVVYKWLFLLFQPVGAVTALKSVWYFADITYGLMAIPNLIALFFLAGKISVATNKYFNYMEEEKRQKAEE